MTSVLVVGDERKGGSRRAIDDFADWLRGEYSFDPACLTG